MLDRVAIRTLAILALATLEFACRAHAALDVWDNTPGGNWSIAANWTDGSVPGISDSATFNLAQSYPVTFNSDPGVIQALSVSAGSVTFQSSGGPRTLSLTAGAGSQDVVVGGAMTTLTLGTTNNPVNLVAGDDLSIQNGGTLAVLLGSNVTANDLSGSGLNGTLRIDGAGSTLTLGGNVANVIGMTGVGSLLLQNNSTGNSINADLGLASSMSTAANGSLSILGGATLSLGGNLTLANQNVAGQIASLSIQSPNSSLTQSGAKSVTVGSAANGTATITIGTTGSGGSFTSGTGLFTINKTGTVTIGGGMNSGTLSVGGDVKIDGGLLNKATTASTLDLAPNANVTILNGGRLTAAGSLAAESNQMFDLSGTNSRIETTASGAFAIQTGANVTVTAAATLMAAGKIDVATAAGTGTLTVAGEGSTLTAGSELSRWGNEGGDANVSLSNKAIATLNAGIDLANSTTAGTSATVSVLSGAVLNAETLNLATSGGSTSTATLHINGTDSSVAQSGAATLTVGHESEGSATINIGTANDGGSLTTGSGLFRINKTGRVTIGDGENAGGLNVLGDILVDGGVLEQRSAESTFAWTTGKTLTVESGGLVHFASAYLSAPSAVHIATGTGSRFEIEGAFHIRSASQVGVLAGAAIDADEYNVGGGGATGSLTIDGAGSTATGGNGSNQWGNGGNASVVLSNSANMALAGSLTLAQSAATTAQVLSGADLAVGDLSIATAGASVNGTLNVVGVGSTLTLHPSSELAIGHATSGAGVLNIDDGGSITVGAGGMTTVQGTGTVNIAAGSANLGALSVVGGAVNVNGGTLTFSSLSINGGLVKLNSGRVEQTGNLSANDALLTALVGPTHELTLGKTIAAAGGAANVSANLDLNGGRLEGNSINVSNSGANATVLRLRNGGTAQANGAAVLAAGTNVFIENAGAFVAGGQLSQASELQLSGTGRVAASSLLNTGLVTGSGRVDANLNNQTVGQIRLAEDQRLVIRGTNHQNNGLIDIDHGELEFATGTFTNGTANPSTATIAARDASLRFTGGLVNAGSIVCSEGTCDFFGNVTNVNNQPTTGRIVVTANSQATFYNDVTNRGTIQVSAAGLVTSSALFLGSLSGNGVAGSGSVFLEGNVQPGSTIGTMAFGGDASVGAGSTVRMDIAGTAAGQFDRITVAQSLVFSGTLQLSLSGGFMPSIGQSFDLFDWGTRSGTFATLMLPSLNGLTWNTSQLYTTGVVSIAAATLAGDFNGDGAVDAADYTVWRDGLGSTYTQADYAIWKSHFGQSTGGAATAFSSVPEPAALAITLVAMLQMAVIRREKPPS